MAGGFLQTSSAKVLRAFVSGQEEMSNADRGVVLSFLAGSHGSEYSPVSGQVTVILKQIHEDLSESLASETATEEEAKSDHSALMAAKSKEIAAHTKAIEEKSVRTGETAVRIVEMKNDLSDTQVALSNDKKFLEEMDHGCDTKAKEWAERQKTRSEELLALAETIKLLNDDDALELFKKSVPGHSASLVQLNGDARRTRTSALKFLRAARGATAGPSRPGVDFIMLALQGSGDGFEKVMAMVDDMVEVLKKEQE